MLGWWVGDFVEVSLLFVLVFLVVIMDIVG